jgi:acetyl-CoA synthetase
MSDQSAGDVHTVMNESRLFPPSDDFVRNALINSETQYNELYQRSIQDPEGFWSELAKSELHWFEPFHTTLKWNEPFAEWFIGGKTNASYNCVDAHVA